MLTDPISDFLTRVRNASHAKRDDLSVPSSNMIKAIANVLLAKGLVTEVKEVKSEEKSFPELMITLRTDRDPLELKRMSKPGQRIYMSYKEIKRVRNGLGIGIISTSAGLIADDEARRKKLGGEYICQVY